MPVSKMDEIKPLYDAVQLFRGEYTSGGADYSVTTLLSPPRVVFLNKRHLHKVDLFVEDLLHSYNGTAAHSYWQYCLEKIPNTPYKCEERLWHTVLDRSISGQYDALYEERDMYDMKNTSVWKAMFGDKLDWTAQQNMYRYMYYLEHQKKLRSVRIIGLFRDWSKREMQRSSYQYPKYPAVEYVLPIWDFNQTQKFMEGKVEVLKDNEDVADGDLPECTFEDMWCKPDQVAVKSTRVKRALRVLPTQEKANEYVDTYLKQPSCKDKPKQISFEVRPSVRTRCEHWCPVNKYCSQYQDYLKQKGKANG
jgi:hypothetical protein